MNTPHLLSRFLLCVAVGFSFVPMKVFADQMGSDSTEFKGRIEAEQQACAKHEPGCSLPNLKRETIYERRPDDLTRTSESFVLPFQKIAEQQAQMWADTILEGEYAATGETLLDRVEALSDGQGLVAYHITYSQHAWFTGNCDPDHELHKCDAGHIQESTFVSPSKETWMRDNFAFADFLAAP